MDFITNKILIGDFLQVTKAQLTSLLAKANKSKPFDETERKRAESYIQQTSAGRSPDSGTLLSNVANNTAVLMQNLNANSNNVPSIPEVISSQNIGNNESDALAEEKKDSSKVLLGERLLIAGGGVASTTVVAATQAFSHCPCPRHLALTIFGGIAATILCLIPWKIKVKVKKIIQPNSCATKPCCKKEES